MSLRGALAIRPPFLLIKNFSFIKSFLTFRLLKI